MKITVLIENTCPQEGLVFEHGLSLFLEHEGRHYLLDAGQSDRFFANAARLGCDLSTLECAVLSHGHYDHANGFASLLHRNDTLRVYARCAVSEPRYADDGRYIGLCQTLLTEYPDRFDRSDEAREIAPGLWLIPDAVAHEQSLVAETKQGLVIMNSCCHAGADNIVADVLSRFPGKGVFALIGGLHLMGPGGVTTLGKEPDAVRDLARRLTGELGVEKICTGHCTGSPALALIQEEIPDHLICIHTGDILSF